MLEAIKELFIIDDSYKTSKNILITTLIGAFLAYNLLIIYGYTNPDGIIEGLTYYNNAYVASAMSGRWFVRYIEFIFAGIVNPTLQVLFYVICVTLSVLLLKKIFPKMSKASMYLSALILMVNSVTVTQFTYLYIGLIYAFGQLMSVLFVYLNINKKTSILSIIPLALALGLYQSYIGMMAALTLMYIIYKLINNEFTINELFNYILRVLLSVLIGGILYFILVKIDRSIHKVDEYDRLASLSLENIFSNLGNSINEAYKGYFKIYLDAVLKRRYLYLFLFICLLISLFIHFKNLLNNNKIINIILIIISFILLPLFSNIVKVVIPDNELYIMMEYQVFLLIPFILILIDCLNLNYLKYISLSLVGLVFWTYVLGSNATYKCYELSYRHINNEYSMILNDIYHTEGYEKDKTPIIIAGFVDDYELKRTNYLYHYTIEFPENPAFWLDYNGIGYNRYHYFLNYFGVNPQVISDDDYKEVIESDYFKEMNIWPKENSIVYKDGKIIVKLTNDPIK